MSKAQAETIDLAAITYKDLLDLVYRAGIMKYIQSYSVHENDQFMHEQGSTPMLRHEPAESNRGNVTHYYAMFHTSEDRCGFAVMNIQEILPEGVQIVEDSLDEALDDFAKKVVILRALRQCLKAG